ncbi:MAG: AAA family ATPase, partial [Gemmatimonadetes bacterium]|nr:AAA family ATPase [Gemmatimonadota bacterium]
GQGSAVFLEGEAGTGKTSLARAFLNRALDDHKDLIAATGFSDPHTGLGDPHRPFREILRVLTGDVEAQWMAGSITTDLARRLWGLLPKTTETLLDVGPDLLGVLIPPEALAARLAATGLKSEKVGERLAQAPIQQGGDPDGRKQAALFEQYGQVVRQLSRVRPLLLVLEDLQWADSGSLDLLFQLGRRLEGSRILVLGLYRPSDVAIDRDGKRHPLQKVLNEFRGKSGDLRVSLDDPRDRSFTDAILDSHPNIFSDSFRKAFFERTQGNGLFATELLRELKEKGGVSTDESGVSKEGPNLDWTLLPTRIEAVIEERTSRLPGRLLRLLQVASVEGEYFTLEAIAQVLDREPHQLIQPLSGELEKQHHLVWLHGVHRVGDRRISVYRFRHILFQEFLYGQLDGAERAYLHERTARALEDLHQPRSNSQALQLARHFQEAGLTGESISYLLSAGHQARASGAFEQSLTLTRQARALLPGLPDSEEKDRTELEILTSLSVDAWILGLAIRDPDGILSRLREVSSIVGDEDRLFWALECEFSRHHFLGEPNRCREIVDEMEGLAAASRKPNRQMAWKVWRAFNALNRGYPAEALVSLQEISSELESKIHRDILAPWIRCPLPFIHSLKALALGPLGRPAEGHGCIEESYQLLENQHDPTCTLYVRLHDHLFSCLCRTAPGGVEKRPEPTRPHGEPGHEGWRGVFQFVRGYCSEEHGDPHTRAATLEDAIRLMDAGDWLAWRPYFGALQASVLGEIGRAEEGLEIVDGSLDRIEATGERFHEADVNRVRGEILGSVSTSRVDEAEDAFRRAVSIGRDQKAKLFELRATVSLARLLERSGRAKEGRRELSRCYKWFTEGFDFPDLKEARALLAELG